MEAAITGDTQVLLDCLASAAKDIGTEQVKTYIKLAVNDLSLKAVVELSRTLGIKPEGTWEEIRQMIVAELLKQIDSVEV